VLLPVIVALALDIFNGGDAGRYNRQRYGQLEKEFQTWLSSKSP
jgi:hypothetical protein